MRQARSTSRCLARTDCASSFGLSRAARRAIHVREAGAERRAACRPGGGPAISHLGIHHASATRRIRLSRARAGPAGRGGGERADRASARALRHRRLSGRRHHHRSLRAGAVRNSGKHHPGRRAGRRHAAVPDRPRARARPADRDAPPHIRPRRRPIDVDRRRDRRPWLRDRLPRLARRHRRRARAGDVGDRDRAANPGGTRPASARLWPARLRHPAVPGSRRGAASGRVAAPRPRKRERACEPRRRAARSRLDRRRDRAHRRRRPLPAQSVLPPAGADRLARGDDGGRAPGRARRRPDHGNGRHVDGARRVPGRHAARRIRTTATSSKPTSSRSAASCSRCSSWGSA